MSARNFISIVNSETVASKPFTQMNLHYFPQCLALATKPVLSASEGLDFSLTPYQVPEKIRKIHTSQ